MVFTLNAGNADFPFIMSDYHLAIMPAIDGKIDPLSTDGCGPYVVDSFEHGVEARMSRNPNYWKTDRAHFDGVELLPIVDAAARQNALMSGQVDLIDRVDLNTVHLLERAPNIKIVSVSGTQHYVFPMDSRAAPFDDNNVRMALKHAIDREEMVEKILNGYGVVGNDHPIGRSNRFHADDLEQRVYDPDKAKFYLKEAGLDSLEVTLSVSDAAFGGAVDAGVLFSEKAANAGITINVVARTGRRLLVQRLDAEAVLRQLLGRPPDRGLDVLHRLRFGRFVERQLLGTRTVQRAAPGSPLGTRRRQAPRDVFRDAEHPARRGQRDRSDVRQLRDGPYRCSGDARPDRLQLDNGRLPGHRTVVVRLIG